VALQNNKARSRAAQLRAKAILTQIATAVTYCSTAEHALIVANVQQGRLAIEKAKHVVQVVRAHLSEPRHVPADSVADILKQLAQLERQISQLEEQFSAATG
jgi:hypothetical protein